MEISKVSIISGKRSTMDLPVTPDQLVRYNEGVELVQNIFPNLSPEQREFLISGITPEEWAETMDEENE